MSQDVDKFARLGRKLREEAHNAGLELKQFLVVPDLDGEHHTVSGIFTLDEEQKSLSATTEANPEFDKMIDEQMRAEEEAKIEQARKELKQLEEELRDPRNGLGLDD